MTYGEAVADQAGKGPGDSEYVAEGDNFAVDKHTSPVRGQKRKHVTSDGNIESGESTSTFDSSVAANQALVRGRKHVSANGAVLAVEDATESYGLRSSLKVTPPTAKACNYWFDCYPGTCDSGTKTCQADCPSACLGGAGNVRIAMCSSCMCSLCDA